MAHRRPFDDEGVDVAGSSPTVRRRELGARLRGLRLDLGLSIDDVAARMEVSAAKVSRLGTGARGVSNSADGGCVEVAPLPDGGVAVRDSKIRSGAVLTFNRHEWVSFPDGMAKGEFDHLV